MKTFVHKQGEYEEHIYPANLETERAFAYVSSKWKPEPSAMPVMLFFWWSHRIEAMSHQSLQ